MNIFIIHGSYGYPEENWFPYIKYELEKLGHNVIVPKFPTPVNQSLQAWLKTFKKYDKYLDKNSIVIGHSLGVAFLLRLIEEKPIKAAFFVSGSIGLLNNPQFDKINSTFTTREFNWKNIHQNCKKFYIYHSDNDPYVPIEKSNELAKYLNVKTKIVKNAGHFNTKSGYTQFELLLRDIKKII